MSLEVTYIEPPGTFVIPILSRRLSDRRIEFSSIRIARLDPTKVIAEPEKLDPKITREILHRHFSELHFDFREEAEGKNVAGDGFESILLPITGCFDIGLFCLLHPELIGLVCTVVAQ